MSARLEEIRAAVKAKQDAGQPIFTQQVDAPKIQTPTAVSPAPVSNPSKSASVASPIQTEIQRKAAAGIPLTNPTAATQAAYNAAKPQVSSPAVAVKAPTAQPTSVQPNTNYVAQGGQTLNDILYLKDNYNAGNKNYIATQANPLYAKLDSGTAAAVKGMSADQLRSYINGLGSQNSPSLPAAVQQNDPQFTGQQYVPQDYTQLATAAYEQQLAQLLQGAQSQEKELNRRNDYATGVTRDNRQLQDASFSRNNSPTAWDGSTGYRGAMMDRGRNIEDHYTAEGLTDAVAAAYGSTNTFRDQAGNFISTESDRLKSRDQQFALQEGQLTGQYNGQKTLAGQQQSYNQMADNRNFNYQAGQDQIANNANYLGTYNGQQTLQGQSQSIANQIAKINLDNYPTQVKLGIQQLQQQVDSGKISNATAQYQLQELTNPSSVTNQVAALDLQMKQIDASNYSAVQKAQLEQLQKTVAQIGAVKPVSEYEQQMQYLDLQKAALQVQKLQDPKSVETKTYEDYQPNIEKLAVRDSKTGALKNPDAIKTYITNSDMSTYEKYRAWVSSGLEWPSNVEIPTPGE